MCKVDKGREFGEKRSGWGASFYEERREQVDDECDEANWLTD